MKKQPTHLQKEEHIAEPVAPIDNTTTYDVEEFLKGIHSNPELQQQIFETLSAIDSESSQILIAGREITLSDESQQALQELKLLQVSMPVLPYFSPLQILQSKHFDQSEGFNIELQVGQLVELISPEIATLICFNIQRAINDSEDDTGVHFTAIQFVNIFDHVQLMRVEATSEGIGFIVKIFFHWVKRYAEMLQIDAEKQDLKLKKLEQEQRDMEELLAQKKVIISHVQRMMEEKERGETISVIQKYIQLAQAPYKTLSMNEVALSGTYTGPPKYLKQRDQPLEIPMDCIRKLCDTMDTTYDERVSLAELKKFVLENNQKLPFEEGIVEKMFEEAASGRGFVTPEQMKGSLTHDEVAAAVRGRHQWNTETKKWQIKYRPYRDYWIALLLIVNQKIFALPMPKIVPQRIKAQFELEQDYNENYLNSKITAVNSASQQNRLYHSVSEIKKATFQRDMSKTEAGINPDFGYHSTIRLQQQIGQQKVTKSAFENQINMRTHSQTALPRVTFSAKEVYDQVQFLSAKIPFWTSENQNPVNQFVPSQEQPFKKRPDDAKQIADQQRLARYSSMQNKNRALQLATTMALSKRPLSPISKLQETRGTISIKRVPDNFEVKNAHAQAEYPKSGFSYKQPSTYVFRPTDRETALAYGQKDFGLITHPDPIPNPCFISEYNPKPKFWSEKEKLAKLKQEVSEGLKGKETWEQYHKKLPLKHVPLAGPLPDKLVRKEKDQFLQKDKWEGAFTLLTRQINENTIVGKPPLQKYFPVMKPEHLNREFDGTFKPYQVISM